MCRCFKDCICSEPTRASTHQEQNSAIDALEAHSISVGINLMKNAPAFRTSEVIYEYYAKTRALVCLLPEK